LPASPRIRSKVWLSAITYYLFVDVLGSAGSAARTRDYVLRRHLHVIRSGVEALVGLLMIGCSASFTDLVMEKFWPMHGGGKVAARLCAAPARSARRIAQGCGVICDPGHRLCH
jgi:hypothetical protein